MESPSAVASPPSAIPTRDQIAIEDTWDLSTIYADERAWDEDAARMPDLIAAAASHTGSLDASPARLRQALDDVMTVRQALERLRVYAQLRRDEDTARSEALARYEKSIAIAIQAATALANVEPELLAIPP